MFNFKSLEKSIADIKSQALTLRNDIKKKKQQCDALNTLPLPRDDFAAGICRMLDNQAKLYPERLATTLRGVIANPSFDFESSKLDLVSGAGGVSQPGTLPRENALWFFGEQIKKQITAAIMKMSYPDEVGLPLAARKTAIEKLDKQITALETQAADLQAQAAAAGVSIQGIDPAPTKKAQRVVLTERVKTLVESTPYPDYVIRSMLADGLDPLEEMKKIPKPSPDNLDQARGAQSVKTRKRGLVSQVTLN